MSEPAIRFGEADLTTCDREPIHIPGSIQPHGVLLVVDRRRYAVEQVAGDSASMLGLEPDLDAFVSARLNSATEFIPPVMRLGVRSRTGPVALDLTLHASAGTAII